MKKATIIGIVVGGAALVGAVIAAYVQKENLQALVDKTVARLKKNAPQESDD